MSIDGNMMGKISSGSESLDSLIGGFSIGDNVVWETEAGTLSGVFIKNFITRSIADYQKVIYVSFNRSPQTVMNELGQTSSSEHFTLVDCFTSGKGKNDNTFLKFYEKSPVRAVKIEDPRNIVEFTKILNAIEDRLPPGARYVFDSLTGMQDLWGDENETHRFFTYMCPRLYDLGTVAYWMLEKDAHTPRFKANLRHITQVVLDLSKRKNNLYLKALKFEGSEDREAFKTHQYEVKDNMVILTSSRRESAANIGRRLKEERLRIGMSQKELADKVGLTPSFISQLENDQVSPSLGAFALLCKTLGVNPGVFLNFEDESPATWLIKNEAIFSSRPRLEDKVRVYEPKTDIGFSARFVVIPAGFETRRHFTERKSEELLFVVDGNLLVTVSGRRERVVSGDLMCFKESFPSQWKNEGGDEALILVVS